MSTYTVTKTFSFCYAHRLLGDTGKCRHLHGHTAKVEISISSGKLDNDGMVMHFDRLKDSLGKWIADNLDHSLLLSKDDPLAGILKEEGEKVFELPCSPTAENIARIIFEKAAEIKMPVSEVIVWESETSKASYKR